MKNAKTLLRLLGSVLLMLVVGYAFALPPRITWNPNPLVTEEIVPGNEEVYTVSLTNTGYLPILAAYQMQIVAEGSIDPYVDIAQPKFPNLFKPGQSVTFSVNVSVPDDAPAGEVTGSLVLKRIIRNKVVDVWRAEALPVSIAIVQDDPDPAVISWSKPNLAVTATVGTATGVSVDVSGNEDLSDLSVSVDAGLAALLSISPEKIPSLPQGQTQAIALWISVPANTPSGWYSGTLHVTQGQTDRAVPLAVDLEVIEATPDKIPPIVALPSADRIVVDPISGNSVVTEELEVYFRDGMSEQEIKALVGSLGGVFLGSIPELNSYQIRFPGLDADGLRVLGGRLLADGYARHASLHRLHDALATTNDPFWQKPEQSWGQQMIGLPAAWDISTGKSCASTPVKVAVIDTDFTLSHEDLGSIVNGASDGGSLDPSVAGHGTNVVGILGATANNGKGIAGVLSDAMVTTYPAGVAAVPFLIAKVDDLKAREHAIAAIKSGARVINYSAGSDFATVEEAQMGAAPWAVAVEWARLQGHKTLFVFPVANKAVDVALTAPATLALDPLVGEDVIAVGAINIAGALPPDRGYGDGITVAAPGEGIYTTAIPLQDSGIPFTTNNYYSASGASFAAPFVSGVAGLMLSVNEALSPPELKQLIEEGAEIGGRFVTPPEGEGFYVLNADESVRLARDLPSVSLDIGDRVKIRPDAAMTVSVWDAPNGSVMGGQEPAAGGAIRGGPIYAGECPSWWWQVDFDTGADGWVVAQYLNKTGDAPWTPISSVAFLDPSLGRCVLEGAAVSGWLSVEQFNELSCVGKGIISVVDLAAFTNLRVLDLSNNQIRDVAALQHLTNLERLVLTGNDGIRCVELDALQAALPSTVVERPAQCVQESSNFRWPVEAPNLPMSNSYSAFNVIDNNKYHAGFDLTSSTGSLAVFAAADGVVRTVPNGTYVDKDNVPNNHGMGHVVIIDHNSGKGPFTLYAHLASITVQDGASVNAGAQIGVMGNTGCEPCDIHLHFEVKQWGVLGNLHDDLGAHWGYTPGLPNLYGYLNPWVYLDNGLSPAVHSVVRAASDEIVRTGPGASYTAALGSVGASQQFVASRQVGDWYEIDFPSESGPAKGWIQGAQVAGGTQWEVQDPVRGLIGVSVCPTASACGGLAPPARLSYMWDEQRVLALEQVPAQNGCESQWIRTSVLNGESGWVCGDYLVAKTGFVGSHPLNDTGITTCGNGTTNGLPCPVAGFPGQDAEYGRDVTHNDDSDGHAGFSFTKLDAGGNALPASAAAWSCVQDNVTGLVWEVKTDDGGLRDKDNTYTWYDPDASTNGGFAGTQNGGACTGSACDTEGYQQAVNAAGLCGASNWRMPSPGELLSIVSNDRINPSIDTGFFPNTQSTYFWSSSPYAFSPSSAWYVYFSYGYVYDNYKALTRYVRLVRGGQ